MVGLFIVFQCFLCLLSTSLSDLRHPSPTHRHHPTHNCCRSSHETEKLWVCSRSGRDYVKDFIENDKWTHWKKCPPPRIFVMWALKSWTPNLHPHLQCLCFWQDQSFFIPAEETTRHIEFDTSSVFSKKDKKNFIHTLNSGIWQLCQWPDSHSLGFEHQNSEENFIETMLLLVSNVMPSGLNVMLLVLNVIPTVFIYRAFNLKRCTISLLMVFIF